MLANEMKSSMSQLKKHPIFGKVITESKGLKMSYSREGPQVGQSWLNIIFLKHEKLRSVRRARHHQYQKGDTN